jgi:hypothetical protein
MLAACGDDDRRIETNVGGYYAAELTTALAGADHTSIGETCADLEELALYEQDYIDARRGDKPTWTAVESTQSAQELATALSSIGKPGPLNIATVTPEEAVIIEIADKTLEAEFREELPDLKLLGEFCDTWRSNPDSNLQEQLTDLWDRESG